MNILCVLGEVLALFCVLDKEHLRLAYLIVAWYSTVWIDPHFPGKSLGMTTVLLSEQWIMGLYTCVTVSLIKRPRGGPARLEENGC